MMIAALVSRVAAWAGFARPPAATAEPSRRIVRPPQVVKKPRAPRTNWQPIYEPIISVMEVGDVLTVPCSQVPKVKRPGLRRAICNAAAARWGVGSAATRLVRGGIEVYRRA